MKATKLIGVSMAILMVALLTASPAMAQTPAAGAAAPMNSVMGLGFGKGLGTGLVLIGAAWGFGRIGGAALESMARQPEKAGAIQTAMIIIGALLEGATFFALIVCFTI